MEKLDIYLKIVSMVQKLKLSILVGDVIMVSMTKRELEW